MNNVINQIPYLRTSRHFPKEAPQLSVELSKSYIDIANSINARTIGIFPTSRPAITGESWFLSKNQRQQTFRQVYTFGAIAPGKEFDIPIDIGDFFSFSHIWGTVVTNVIDWRPLPYVDPVTLTTGIALLVGPISGKNNIRIVVGTTSPAITSGLVVLEWLSKP